MEWQVFAVCTLALVVLLMLGVPISFSMAAVSLVGLIFLIGWPKALSLFTFKSFSTIASFLFVSVPLYILMAEIVSESGIASRMFTSLRKFLGSLTGGLAFATNIACGIFSAMVGTSIACVAVIGKVAVPEMLRHGYDHRFAAGVVCTGGALGILIPPSIPMILYAMIANVSLGKLFIGGIIPGVLLVLIRSIYIFGRCTLSPQIAPPVRGVSWKEKALSLKDMVPVTILVVLVLVTIYGGVATPTEAAALGVAGALFIGIAYRSLKMRTIGNSLQNTLGITAMISILIVGATLYNDLAMLTGIPKMLAAWVTSMNLSPWLLIIFINILYFILGCFLDTASMMFLTVPVLLPTVTLSGFDPIWFGIMIMVNAELAVVTPPFGLNLYVLHGVVPEISIKDILLGSLPFLLLDLITLFIIIAFPIIVMFLPNLM